MAVSRQWQLVRDWLRKVHNKDVHEFFRDLPSDVDPDNSTSRRTTKAVCLIGSQDSQGIAGLKLGIFKDLKSRAGLYPQPHHPYVAFSSDSVEGYPQVQLWFYEKLSTAQADKRRTHAVRISFRIKDKKWSPIEGDIMARRIRDIFARPIFNFEIGKLKYTYKDKDKGQLFILPTPDEPEARRVLEKVFDLMNESPNWDNLSQSKASRDLSATKTVSAYGKSVRVSRRPETQVYFRYAIAKVPPLHEDIPLVDTTMAYPNALYYESNLYLTVPSQPRGSYSPRSSLL